MVNKVNTRVDIYELDSPTWKISLKDAEKILNDNIVVLFGTNFGKIKIEEPARKPERTSYNDRNNSL